MTNEERDLITQFVARVGGQPAQAGFGQPVGGAVAPLPPVDREADALLAELFNRYPEARYRVTQLAFVQEHALAEAQNRIARLQADLQTARAQAAQAAQAPAASPWGAAAQPQQAGQPTRSFFSGLFGGGAPAPQQAYAPQPQYAPPPPQYAPGYGGGMFPQQGTGFLGSALRTAAGVAGGVLAADAISSLFSGGHHDSGYGGAGFGGAGFGGGSGFGGGTTINETTVNETIIEQAPASPWGSAPVQDTSNSGWLDSSSSSDQGSSWDDTSSSSDSGWGNDDST